MNHRIIILFVAGVLLSGCSLISAARRVVSPTTQITTSGGTVLNQRGDAQSPAVVNTTTTKIPVPAGTEIIVNEKALLGDNFKDLPAPITLRLARDTVIETRTEHAAASQAFTPPAPPTPVQLADGQARLWWSIGLIVGGAAVLFGLVRGWDFVMYGGAAVAGACAFALFIQSHPILFAVIGLGVALKFAGPYFWHKHLKHTGGGPTDAGLQ